MRGKGKELREGREGKRGKGIRYWNKKGQRDEGMRVRTRVRGQAQSTSCPLEASWDGVVSTVSHLPTSWKLLPLGTLGHSYLLETLTLWILWPLEHSYLCSLLPEFNCTKSYHTFQFYFLALFFIFLFFFFFISYVPQKINRSTELQINRIYPFFYTSHNIFKNKTKKIRLDKGWILIFY